MPDINNLISVDPVCGHKILPKSDFKEIYENNTYYFCSKKCYNSFKKNPKKYSLKAHNNSLFRKKVTSNLDNSELFNKEVILKITGNPENSGSEKIELIFADEKGIIDFSTDLINKKIRIKYNPDLLSEKDLLDLFGKSGLKAEYIKTATVVFVVSGINNNTYAWRLEDLLIKLPGVIKASVNFATEEATINFRVDETDASSLVKTINNAGFGAISIINITALNELKENKEKQFKYLRERTVISFLLSVLIFIFNTEDIFPSFPVYLSNPLLSLFLATPVQFWGGYLFYKNGLKAIRNLEIEQNVLVIMATTPVYLYSLLIVMLPGSIISQKPYFEVSAVMMTLFLLSDYSNSLMKENISNTFERLSGLQPKKVKKLEKNKIEVIPYNTLQVEDIINIEPGEKIPVDGIITDGSSFVDEFINTGNSTPVLKSKGELVVSGSINKSGPINLQATRVGLETFLAKYINYLEIAYSSKTKLQIQNKILLRYYPNFILLASLITFIAWFAFSKSPGISFALLNAVSIIAVNIPCILGVSIPFALIISIKKGSENGWIYKNAESLEAASKVTTIIFDKTGILTQARPIITDIMTFNGFDGNTVLKIAASIENHSEHILGNAIVQEAKNKNFDLWIPVDFHYILGMGIEANVNGYQAIIGSKQLMRLKNVEMDTMERMAKKLSGEGKTTIFIAIAGKAAGIIAISDIIREDSRKAVEKLKRLGMELVLLTGDNQKMASFLAEQVGISNNHVIAEASPTQKVKFINSLQKEGRVVAIVSEKINDSPALKKADLIFSFENSFNNEDDVNRINFISNDLEKIAAAIQFSKRTIKTIKQNLYLAYIYNLIALPVAGGLLLPFFSIRPDPVIISLATVICFIFILINSLELRKINPL